MDLPAAPRRPSGWLVPVLATTIGILVIFTGAATGAWLNTRSDLRKLDAASHTVASVGDSMIADLRDQVNTLQTEVSRLQASYDAANQAARALGAQARNAQRNYRTATACIDDIIQEYNSASFASELPRHFGAALNGANCSALGYYFS